MVMPIPVPLATMESLREVEEMLDQSHGILVQLDSVFDHLGDTDAHTEFCRLKSLTGQASAQATRALRFVKEERLNRFPRATTMKAGGSNGRS